MNTSLQTDVFLPAQSQSFWSAGDLKLVAHNGAADTGWLICDGSAVSRTTFAGLFAKIGTFWGVGDGSTTFNLPNSNTPNGGSPFIRSSSSVVFQADAVGASGGSNNHTHNAHTSANVGILGVLSAALTGPATHANYTIASVTYRLWIKT